MERFAFEIGWQMPKIQKFSKAITDIFVYIKVRLSTSTIRYERYGRALRTDQMGACSL